MLNPANLNDLLESSDVVGNIRFSHPTLYVFPGGQGDAALFGINGFNMLGESFFFKKIFFSCSQYLFCVSFESIPLYANSTESFSNNESFLFNWKFYNTTSKTNFPTNRENFVVVGFFCC